MTLPEISSKTLVLGTALLLALASPAILFWMSVRTLHVEPCVQGAGDPESLPAPSLGMRRALSVLGHLRALPLLSEPAARMRDHATFQCSHVYASACAALRDRAVDARRAALLAHLDNAAPGDAHLEVGWRAHVETEATSALCERWALWSAHLGESGVDAAGLCPLCAPPPRDAAPRGGLK